MGSTKCGLRGIQTTDEEHPPQELKEKEHQQAGEDLEEECSSGRQKNMSGKSCLRKSDKVFLLWGLELS